MPGRAFEPPDSTAMRPTGAQLPQRLAQLCRRGARLRATGWDVNTLALLASDATALAAACRRLDADALADSLERLHGAVAPLLEPPVVPDEPAMARFAELVAAVATHSPPLAEHGHPGGATPTQENGFPLMVVPPPRYWTRFGDVPTAAPIAESPEAEAEALAEQEAAAAAPAPVAAAGALRVSHLSSGDELADAIDALLAANGFAVTRFEDPDALAAAMESVRPALVLVGAGSLHAIDTLGAKLRPLRKQGDTPTWLVALTAPTNVDTRLHAVRMGCDALIEAPAGAEAVVARIAELTENARDPYRVMIVEDDRAQTVFAESILRKAGMRTLALTSALDALDELERFDPDLILMDLYMPGCDGIDLTTLIRQREAFVATPIVFLSGEHNTDRHFEALDAGGDDFLAKPIRPKHLISAVTNRIRRARRLRRRGAAPVQATRLRHTELLRRIDDYLALDDAHTRNGGLLVLVLADAARRRERLGEARYALLLDEILARLATLAGARDVVASDRDDGFLVFNSDRDAPLLEALAVALRERLAQAALAESDGPVALAAGVCPFVAGATSADAMLAAAREAAGQPHTHDGRGVGLVRDVEHKADAAMVARISDALHGDGFQLAFQPIVSLHGDEGEHFQALLRLRRDDGGLHTAAEIVPAAEQAGLIVAVDRWVMERCAATVAVATRNGRVLRLFVSQSVASMRDQQQVDWLCDLLARYAVPARSLSIELPSGAATGGELGAWTSALAALGMGITLAGFDTDAAAELKWPIEHVKLAARHLRAGDDAAANELRALIASVHDAGKRAIAPRVENARSVAALWSAGIDFIQGNFVQQATDELSFDFDASAT